MFFNELLIILENSAAIAIIAHPIKIINMRRFYVYFLHLFIFGAYSSSYFRKMNKYLNFVLIVLLTSLSIVDGYFTPLTLAIQVYLYNYNLSFLVVFFLNKLMLH